MKKQIIIFVAVIGLSACHKTQADSVHVKEESHQVAESVELDAMPFVLIESNSQYESLKTQINDDKLKSMSGKYEYKSGESYASVDIEYKGNKEFTFEISTENGIRCTGEVSGTATIDESGIGKYSSDDCESLTFKFTSTKLTIDETECDDLHGLGCWFSGNYLKAK